jgi:site-specific DNA-methyltransferase (adenine-specific)
MGCGQLEEKFMNGMDKMGGEQCGMLTGSGNPRVGTNSNNHPTVKPIALMKYLCKLATPKNGTVLDPFTGSGSTLIAAKEEGFSYIGFEMEKEYVNISNCRLSACENQIKIDMQ